MREENPDGHGASACVVHGPSGTVGGEARYHRHMQLPRESGILRTGSTASTTSPAVFGEPIWVERTQLLAEWGYRAGKEHAEERCENHGGIIALSPIEPASSFLHPAWPRNPPCSSGPSSYSVHEGDAGPRRAIRQGGRVDN